MEHYRLLLEDKEALDLLAPARAGTDCLAAMLRAASELDADATIVSLDGRSAYDTVSRCEVAPDLTSTYIFGGTRMADARAAQRSSSRQR